MSNDLQQDNVQDNAKRQKLSVRLIRDAIFSILIIAIIISGLQWLIAYRQAVDTVNRNFSATASVIMDGFATDLWAVEQARINATLDALAASPNVGKIVLTNELQQQWLRNEKSTATVIGRKKYQLVYTNDDLHYPVGKIDIELIDGDIVTSLHERITTIAITTVSILVLGVVVVFILFQQWVTQHLQQMANFTQSMDIHSLDKKLTLNRKANKIPDELDVVVLAINSMQLSIKRDIQEREKIQQELALHKENLEAIVKERTLALEAKTYLLEAKSEELAIKNRELDSYAHSVAHDLKNPLTTLIGMSGLLNSDSLKPEQSKKAVETLHRTALKMNDIVGALLLLAGVRRAGEVKIELIDAKKIAEEACARLSAQIEQHNAVVSFVGEWRLACGHPQWIEEVWVNYLSNAIKYGGIPPIIELGAQPISENQIKFWVQDCGPGITDAKAAELFIQFSRLDATNEEGHGLGLSIVKQIVIRLKGTVGFEAVATGGSRFWFCLPRNVGNCS